MPKDGRKWRQKCVQRQRIVMLLSTFADGDGSRITVGVTRLAQTLEMSRSQLFVYLSDLDELGILTNEGRIKERGTALRRLNVPDQESGIRHQESDIGVTKSPGLTTKSPVLPEQESGIGHQESGLGPDTTVTVPTQTDTPTDPVSVVGGVEATIVEIVEYFAKLFPDEVITEKLGSLKELVRLHGKLVFEAWKLYLRDWQYPFTGERKTKLPVLMFVKTFDQWKVKVEHGHSVVGTKSLTPADIDSTTRYHLEQIKKEHEAAGYEVKVWTDETGEHIKVESKGEPGPEALFGDDTPETT